MGKNDAFRRLDQYRTFAPNLRSVVATLEGTMGMSSLTAALSRHFQFDLDGSYYLQRTLSLLSSGQGDLRAVRQQCVDLVIPVERMPTSTPESFKSLSRASVEPQSIRWQ